MQGKVGGAAERALSHCTVKVAHARAATSCTRERPFACKSTTDENFGFEKSAGRGCGRTCLDVEEAEIACNTDDRLRRRRGGEGRGGGGAGCTAARYRGNAATNEHVVRQLQVPSGK